MKEFDENDVVRRIRENLPTGETTSYTDDDLLNIVDMIWDYYEINGLLDVDIPDDDNEEDIDLVAELRDYCIRMLKKDKACRVKPEHLESIITAELDYEDSLEN